MFLKNPKILIAVFCLVLFALAGEADAALLFDGKFAQSDHWVDQNHFSSSAYGANYNSCLLRPASLQVVNDPLGQRGYVGKFNVILGDLCNSPTNDRAMLAKIPYIETEGADRYYSVSVYIPNDFGTMATAEWLNFWEIMIGTSGQEYPAIMLYLKQGSGPQLDFAYGVPGSRKDIRFSSYENIKGKWTDFVVHVKWSSTTAGQVDVWMKDGAATNYGSPVVSDHAAITKDSRNVLEIAMGIYRAYTQNRPPVGTNPRTVYITGIKVGTTFDDVKYGGTSTPLPAHCSNSVKDSDETGIDCGGSCPACITPATQSIQDIIKHDTSATDYWIELVVNNADSSNKVEFWEGSKLLNTELSAPYQTISLSGTHTITGKLYRSSTLVDQITKTFGIGATPSLTQLTLKPGWNQISSTVAAGIDLAAIEQSCTVLQYKNQKLWSWNAQVQSWINPAKVEPLKGYWIYAAYVCTVPISGTPATFSNLQLYSGWNKVSAQGSLSAIAGTCAGHITGNWIWNWDKATDRWVHPAEMQSDKGYWIKVDQNCVLGG